MEERPDPSQWVAEHVLPLESSLRHYVRRYLRAHTDDAANDFLQELYARLLQAQVNRGGIKKPRAYCEWVLKNIYVDRIRRAKVVSIRGVPDLEDLQADEAPGPEQRVSAWEEYALFTKTLAKLDADERESFVLSRFEGWTVRDIAARLGVSAKEIERTLAGTQAKLVRLLAAEGVEAPRREVRRDGPRRETARK